MPKKNDFFSGGLRGLLERAAPRRGPALASAAAFAITAAVVLAAGGKKSFSLDEFETGKVADRDVIAEEPVSFIDEEATRLRAETQLRLVSAVFKYDIGINGDMRRAYDRFVLFSRNLFQEEVSRENYTLGVSAEFPGVFGEEALEALFLDSRREQSLEEGRSALEYFIEAGIFLLPGDPAGNPVSGPAGSPASGPAGGPDSGSILAPASGAAGDLSLYNPDTLELLHNYGERIERERKTYERIITRDRLNAYLARYIEEEKLPREFAPGAGNIVRAILRENVFFSPADTEQRLEEARSQLEPVYRSIERGSRVIRKGFIITAGEMEELRALNLSLERRDPRLAAGQILLLLALYLFFVLHLGRRTAGRSMRDAEYYLLIILAAAYLCGAALTNSFVKLGDHFPVAILLPTALAVMLPAILIGFPMALVSAMMLPLGAFLADSFNTSAYLFALFSGVAAAHVLRHAQKRMDLVRAGLLIAAANAGSALIILLLEQAAPGEYPPVIFWAAFNGLVSALLVIGILPVIEQALNAVTPFRLIELADLNSP
ncbi:MAG: hypothetical protein LBD09_03110, partial [Treponema sp.]|nr:hypothetical protein [Treponema sp.]